MFRWTRRPAPADRPLTAGCGTHASRQIADWRPCSAYARPLTATVERLELPAEVDGCIWLQVDSVSVLPAYIRLGDGDVTVDPNATSSLASEALTTAGMEPMIIAPPGRFLRLRIAPAWTHLAHVSTAAGTLRFGAAP